MRLSYLLLAVSLVGCVKTETRKCGDFTCSQSSVCAPSGDRCVSQSQLDACQGKAGGDGCSFPGTSSGVCDAEVCTAAGCGNGVLEVASGELCDDGNRNSGDGCSADCQSMERCGDGVADFSVGEHCDCGEAGTPPFGCNGTNSMMAGATCRPDCTLGRCGDGVLDVTEFCDDGNNVPGDGCRADCTGRWTLMASNTLADVTDVSALSAQDVYAVAGRRVLHWNGVTWSSMTAPGTIAPHNFERIYAAATDDVFVIGTVLTAGATTNQVYRVHAGAWSDVTPADSSVLYYAIDGRASNVWVSGHADTGTYLTRMGHWNGSSFAIDPPAQSSADFRSLSVAGNGTAWAAEVSGSVGNVVRWQSSWSQFGSIALAHTVAATSGSDVFLFKEGVGASHSVDASASFPGSAFVSIPDSYELNPINDANAIPDYVIAVGKNGAVLICDTTASPGTCNASATGTTASLRGVAVIDKTHAFIVGDAGTILY
jgi:cysteine-rich repeat protein